MQFDFVLLEDDKQRLRVWKNTGKMKPMTSISAPIIENPASCKRSAYVYNVIQYDYASEKRP